MLSNIGYIYSASAKSGVRIETLNKQQEVTHDAPSVFFCVIASQYLSFKANAYTYSMVMLTGQPSGWLVSFCASSLNLVSVTALLRLRPLAVTPL
ncbi:ash family protein [Xenorhabdus bovienii]|uniref:ash family protein n=1 Tax=Xenorhabdus bovienii TaxID=40576 RepID=UPI00237C9340|nr:ash family protein [Xenorhabdus bovienii]MDE1482174.1 ash family protein [Xenorhabdus bovienii]MDE9465606.1 ash family protein [Xenorhabdus bovienii]MDE9468819.1 ash family protein [Xenorhabdus bovienii]MDE9547586.1 ash family protein [Xenorhabdus bovienii]MDE9557417.1 ash family protein [Xenorhabdus bovienii]